MLTIIDVPREIIEAHEKGKELARQVAAAVMSGVEPAPQKHGVNLVTAFPRSCAFIVRGFYKSFFGGRFLRFYSAGDIAETAAFTSLPYEINGEMGSEIMVLDEAAFLDRLASNPQAARLWSNYRDIQAEILRGLCAAYAGEDFKPSIDLREFDTGAQIIKEGDDPDCLFEMIEGSASVRVKDTEVGTVNRGEVFGEISFLTASPRTASVVATSQCTVQAIKGGDFDKIVKFRPTLVNSMARTIAKRLTEVNERLVRISSLT